MIKNGDDLNLMWCMVLCFEAPRNEDVAMVEKKRPRHPSTPDDELRVVWLGRVL
jgi:hypothetical protein